MTLFLAVLVNGSLWFFLSRAKGDLARETAGWQQILFFTVFLLLGLGLIAATFYFLLAAFNPRPTVSVSSRAIPLGGAVEVAWLFEGTIDRLESLRIYLEGREEARYRRGTHTYTDRETFAEIDIVSTSDMTSIGRGEMVIAIPDTTMHSFESSHNKIIWTLKVHGGIRRWPDVKSDYGIVLLPAEATESVES